MLHGHSQLKKLTLFGAASLAITISLLNAAERDIPRNPPKMEWHKGYNGSGEESHPHYVIETGDGGFLMVGETGSIHNRTARVFVVKTNSWGDLRWKQEFGRRGYNLGNCIVEMADGNYVIAGCLDYDAVLIKVDAATGKALWKKTWNLGSEDAFEGVDLTPESIGKAFFLVANPDSCYEYI